MDLPWWALQVLWLVTELFLLVVLLIAAIMQRRQVGVAASLVLAALCCAWFAVHALASWGLFDLGLFDGPEAVLVSEWLLQPVSRVAGLVMWIALTLAVLLPRARPAVEPSGDPFAEG